MDLSFFHSAAKSLAWLRAPLGSWDWVFIRFGVVVALVNVIKGGADFCDFIGLPPSGSSLICLASFLLRFFVSFAFNAFELATEVLRLSAFDLISAMALLILLVKSSGAPAAAKPPTCCLKVSEHGVEHRIR